MITADHLLSAFEATEFHRSQIQGFHYGQGTPQDRYVVRDLTKDPELQNVWVGYAQYGHTDESLEIAVKRCEMSIIACELNRHPEIGDPNVND